VGQSAGSHLTTRIVRSSRCITRWKIYSVYVFRLMHTDCILYYIMYCTLFHKQSLLQKIRDLFSGSKRLILFSLYLP